jgi:pyruvate/2-oxoglutarate dehydrogenase complex dihydrolipoamide dehydrogenase (E3) component
MVQHDTHEAHDLIVIGGGPAGVTAALRGRELGATVALVERANLGGICTNDGCVPTRVLAKAARLMRDAAHFGEYGLDAPFPTVDITRVLDRAQQVVYQVHEKKQLLAHLTQMQIAVYDKAGDAQFVDPHRIRLANGRELTGRKFLIAVGGHARRPAFPGSEHALLHSDVWGLKRLPASVVMVGGGATGCQLASILAAFGCRVSLLEMAPRILAAEDALVSEAVTAEFVKRGIEVITQIGGIDRLEKPDANRDDLILVLRDATGAERRLAADAVILSVGWPGNLDRLNLAAAQVAVNGSYVQVDDSLRTSQPHIYAAGDITGRMMLVQTAGHQARLAVENALAGSALVDDKRVVPHGGFTDPEYASVGLTEEKARQTTPCAVATVPYADLDRAVIDDQPEGFCKLIVHRDTRLLIGAHVVGEQAVEVVQIVATAMAAQMPIEALAVMEFAYPTYAAVIGLAARQLARELHLVHVAAQWRALTRERLAEWERREDFEFE